MVLCLDESSDIIGRRRSSGIQAMKLVNEFWGILDVVYRFPSIFFSWISFPMYEVL
jgi:hypothetical protein